MKDRSYQRRLHLVQLQERQKLMERFTENESQGLKQVTRMNFPSAHSYRVRRLQIHAIFLHGHTLESFGQPSDGREYSPGCERLPVTVV